LGHKNTVGLPGGATTVAAPPRPAPVACLAADSSVELIANTPARMTAALTEICNVMPCSFWLRSLA
jgi:hypothetical protein